MRYVFAVCAALWAAGAATSAPWATALFDELSHDFGAVPRGRQLTHQFRITNNTRDSVQVARLRVSCGCTRAFVQKGFLRPGESTFLVAEMDTSRFTGVRTITIYVEFDQPGFAEARLWVRANSRHDFALTPDTLALGHVKRGAAQRASLVLTFYGNGTAQVLNVDSESNYIEPTVEEVRRDETEVSYRITAGLRPDTPVGRWYSDLWVKTNLSAAPQVRIPLTVTVESALSVSPQEVILDSVGVGEESQRRVIVRGVEPFLIKEVRGTDDQLVVRDSAGHKAAIHVLTVKLVARRPGPIDRTVRVVTDLGEDGRIDFRVAATVNGKAGEEAPAPPPRAPVPAAPTARAAPPPAPAPAPPAPATSPYERYAPQQPAYSPYPTPAPAPDYARPRDPRNEPRAPQPERKWFPFSRLLSQDRDEPAPAPREADRDSDDRGLFNGRFRPLRNSLAPWRDRR